MPLYNPLSRRERYTRHHVRSPHGWGTEVGTDYWLYATSADIVTASGATNLSGLDSFGWTTTALGLTVGSAADFITSADVGAPSSLLFNATADLLQSPVVFGDYAHALMVQQFLGRLPTQLVLECYAAFTTATATETNTCLGFIEDGGSPATANDALATIFSDGVNFGLRSGAAASAVGALVDNAYHLWRIVVDATNCTLTMDGGNSVSVATEADEFPVSFGVHTLTTNRIAPVWAHIYYV